MHFDPAEHFRDFWGKARGGVNGPPWHPLWMHSLDVAAVGWELAALRPRLVARIADRFGWDAAALRDLWVFRVPRRRGDEPK
jgi:hypothetical protein